MYRLSFHTALLFLSCLVALPGFAADPIHSDVFISGEEGYHTYRIPAITTTYGGTVLAFAEGRANRDDHARNDIVLKRSEDGGHTWLPVQVIEQDGQNALNNPCVLTLRDSDRVLLMFQHYPAKSGGERGVDTGVTGKNICRNLLMYSDDQGKTWSNQEDITAQTKRPTIVTSIASGPGNGIELRHGKHAGRIIFPFNQGPYGDWRVYAVYSDDKGKTWSYGDVAPNDVKGLSNEVLMAELSDGRVRINSRSNEGDKLRKTAVSEDGGQTWSPLQMVKDLPEPQCNSGFLRYSDPADGEKSRLLYTGPISQKRRNKGYAHISYDEGETWSVRRELVPGKFAYSALTRLPNGDAGCLYETGIKDSSEKIVLVHFSMDWLTNGKDQLKAGK